MSATFLGAVSMVTSLNISPSVPALAFDMAGAILNSVLYQIGEVADDTMLIETAFVRGGCQIIGYFFLIPEPLSLGKILASLGVNG